MKKVILFCFIFLSILFSQDNWVTHKWYIMIQKFDSIHVRRVREDSIWVKYINDSVLISDTAFIHKLKNDSGWIYVLSCTVGTFDTIITKKFWQRSGNDTTYIDSTTFYKTIDTLRQFTISNGAILLQAGHSKKQTQAATTGGGRIYMGNVNDTVLLPAYFEDDANSYSSRDTFKMYVHSSPNYSGYVTPPTDSTEGWFNIYGPSSSTYGDYTGYALGRINIRAPVIYLRTDQWYNDPLDTPGWLQIVIGPGSHNHLFTFDIDGFRMSGTDGIRHWKRTVDQDSIRRILTDTITVNHLKCSYTSVSIDSFKMNTAQDTLWFFVGALRFAAKKDN